MNGLEPGSFGVGSNRSVNCAKTTTHHLWNVAFAASKFCFVIKRTANHLGDTSLHLLFKYGPNSASFCSQHNNKYSTQFGCKWKQNRWCAWDSNPGLQNGRSRQIHSARTSQCQRAPCLGNPPPANPCVGINLHLACTGRLLLMEK